MKLKIIWPSSTKFSVQAHTNPEVQVCSLKEIQVSFMQLKTERVNIPQMDSVAASVKWI